MPRLRHLRPIHFLSIALLIGALGVSPLSASAEDGSPTPAASSVTLTVSTDVAAVGLTETVRISVILNNLTLDPLHEATLVISLPAQLEYGETYGSPISPTVETATNAVLFPLGEVPTGGTAVWINARVRANTQPPI